jgi:hypothetical protein
MFMKKGCRFSSVAYVLRALARVDPVAVDEKSERSQL